MEDINVAVIGIGNCAKSLIEGVSLYKHNQSKDIDGIMFADIGGYRPGNIKFVAAWDVDKRKVGKPLHVAINQKPNNAWTIKQDASDVTNNTIVRKGPVLDGVGKRMSEFPEDDTFIIDENQVSDAFEDVVKHLKDSKVDVLINYLPVGSEEATRFYIECALEANVAVVNCIPVFIASDPVWEQKFIDKGLPIIGDDMRSQIGASIISAVMQELMFDRGLNINMHYQDNIGGNTDFANMQDQSRLKSKKISKENVIKNQNILHNKEIKENSIHAGPAQYFTALGDNKKAHWIITGTGFGGAPFEFTADLSVQDAPNSAGVVIDAIRFCKVASEMGIKGALHGASAYSQKTPPIDMSPAKARKECLALANREYTEYTSKQV